jgi:hypothetical protein
MAESKLSPEEIIERLRELKEHIPEYAPLRTEQAMAMRRVANLDPAFILSTVSATGESTAVQGALNRTSESMHKDIHDAARWSALEQELLSMHSGVAGGNMVRRHRIGLTALQVYAVARQLVRGPNHDALLPHVENMRRLNTIGKGKRKPKAEAAKDEGDPTGDIK